MNWAARFAVQGIRSARNAGYWLASPVEVAWRAALGREPLPPLWLRRHTGPVGAFESSAAATAQVIDGLGALGPESRVLDLGCGCGAMTRFFQRQLGGDGRYTGLDVHAPSIRWCRDAFATDRRLTFVLAEIRSPYGNGASAATEYRFPLGDAAMDFVLAKSLFTHLQEEEARHYLGEIRRVLAPGGTALLSAFLFDGEREAPPPAFPHPPLRSPVRWKRKSHPHAAVAFDRAVFERWLADAGLAVHSMIPGFWPGAASIPTGQDVLIVS